MSSLPHSGEQDPSIDWLDQSRADMDERYRIARRHSALVRVLKLALPTISIAGVLAFAIYLYVLPEIPPAISAGSIDVSHNSIVMEEPHVSGFMSGGRPYELRADRAEQSLQNTKIVTLQNIGATIGMGNDDTAKIDAESGTYYSDEQRIVLDRKITLATTTGIEGALQSADINLKSGTMHSDQPLSFRSRGSQIDANGVEVRDRGQSISFKNGVKVTYAIPDESSPLNNRAAPSVTE